MPWVDPDFEDVFPDLDWAKLSESERRRCQARLDGLRDQRTILREAIAEGRAKGLAEGLRDQFLQRIKLRFGADALRELEPRLFQLKPEDLGALCEALFDAKDLESARAILAAAT